MLRRRTSTHKPARLLLKRQTRQIVAHLSLETNKAMKQPAELLDPRAKRTRALLQQAMGELLTEHSLASVTIGDITRRASVNRATFYAHFQDKDDLLDSCLREKCRVVLSNALPGQPPDAPETWQCLIKAVLEFFARMPRVCPQAARQWNGIVVNAMREELNRVLAEWLCAARPACPVPPTVIAAVSGAIVTAGMQWLRREANVTTEQGASELTAFLLTGMKGQRQADA